MMLEGWKEIGNQLETISGLRRSRYTLMRWALVGPDAMPVSRDPSNRPFCDSADLEAWWKRRTRSY